MIRFAHPQYFQLLWLVLALAILSWIVQKRNAVLLRRSLGRHAMSLLNFISPARDRLRMILNLICLTLMIVALARPQTFKGQEKLKSEGVEIMFAIDVSTSMLAEDVKPSRLEYAKSELTRLLDLLSGDKVGIIAFAGSATLVSPLTSDKSALKMFLESLSPLSVETQGTEFKKALQEAHDAFERGGVETDNHSKVTRVVLLASDGEDQENGALEEVRKLVSDGIRVFALAFGTERGAPIPTRDERGSLIGYKKDRSGQTIQTVVKGDFLRSLAEAGKGTFYHVTFGGQEAKRIRSDIDRLEKTQFASETSAQFAEQFQIPLFFAVAAGLMALLISRRSGRRPIWKGRFTAIGFVILSSFGINSFASDGARPLSDLDGILENNKGISSSKKNKGIEAYGHFAKSLRELPENSTVHSNLAAQFYINKEYEKALSEYSVAERLARNSHEKFVADFGAAASASALEKVDVALSFYQKALDEKPNSIETKTNIELLTRNGGGGGKGQQKKNNKDQKDQKQSSQDQQNKDNNQPKNQNQGEQKQNQQPKPYAGKEVDKQDVDRILEELKQQEEQVRAKYQREGVKDEPRARDW